VISTAEIQIYHLAVYKYPDKARHLSSGSAFVAFDAAEVLIEHGMDIESNNAGFPKPSLVAS
jgi:hypothetical protein